MAIFIARAYNLPAVSVDFFTDDTGKVYEDAANRLAQQDLTQGCAPSLYCGDDTISRGEMAAFLSRAEHLPDSNTNHFVDDNASIFEPGINEVADARITLGCNPPAHTHFCPTENVTRGQMAAFLTRALGLTPMIPPPRPLLPVGADWDPIIAAEPAGTTFIVESGVHYEQTAVLKHEKNVVSGNSGAGIFHEISYSATIRNNQVRGNGFRTRGWLWEGGIMVAGSQDIQIHGNVVEGNYNGITLIQQNRGSGSLGPYLLRDVSVRSNRVVDSGRTGAVQDVGDKSIFATRNIVFADNDYASVGRFAWADASLGWAQWRGYGMDLTGSIR